MNVYILFIIIPFLGLYGCIKTPEKGSKEGAPEDKNAPPAEMTPEERAYLEEHTKRSEKERAKTLEETKEEVAKLQLEKNPVPSLEKPRESLERARERLSIKAKAKAAEHASEAEKAPQIIIGIFADALKKMSPEPDQDLVNKLQNILSNPATTKNLIQNLRTQAGVSREVTDQKLKEIFKSKGQSELVGSEPIISSTMREVMGTMKDVVSLRDEISYYVKNRDNSWSKEFMQLLINAILNTGRSA